jgi:hypothetical protein
MDSDLVIGTIHQVGREIFFLKRVISHILPFSGVLFH